MEAIRKKVNGIDFEFLLREEEGEFYYKVKGENLTFIMRNGKGTWKIYNSVPIWVKDLEENIGLSIDSMND